jgi:stringent starvation protein B
MPATSWIAHVKAVYQKNKSKGMSYKDALKTAAKSWKKKGAAPKVAAPKKRRRKAKADEDLDEKEPEEEKTAKKPKRKRMRPGVPANEKNLN